MKDFWKYLEYIIWPIGFVILVGGIYLTIISSSWLSKLSWIISTCILLFGNWKGVPKIIYYLKLKASLNSFANKSLDNFFHISDNRDILPHSKVKIDGLSKETSYEYLRGKTKHIMLLNEESSIMKQKIVMACTEGCLPHVMENQLLDATTLRSLSLFMAVNCIKSSKEKYELEMYIQDLFKKDNNLKDWFERWKKVNDAKDYFGSNKNLLYQFLCPKLENISKDSKSKKDKIEEINFLIENLANYKIPIIFLFRYEDFNKKIAKETKEGKTVKELYAEEVFEIVKNYPYFVLTARGKRIGFLLGLGKKLSSTYNFKQIYYREDDIWTFPKGNKVPIVWLIFKNESFK